MGSVQTEVDPNSDLIMLAGLCARLLGGKEADYEAQLAQCAENPSIVAPEAGSARSLANRVEDLEWELGEASRERDRLADKVEAQSVLNSEVLRKYERAVHERNMIEQGMNGYRQVVGVAKRVLPSEAYFKVRKIVRGH